MSKQRGFPGARRRSRAEWVGLVERFEADGSSAKQFCRGAGVNPSTLSWWCWALRQEGATGSVKKARAGRRESDSTRSLGDRVDGNPGKSQATVMSFVELRPVPLSTKPGALPTGADPATGATGQGAIEVLVGSGRVIRLHPGFHRQTFVDVLEVLEGAARC